MTEDGIKHEKVACANCYVEHDSDSDDVIYSERLREYFCNDDCILEYVKG